MIALAGMAFLTPVRQNSTLMWTFFGTAVLLGAWIAAMKFDALRRNRTFTIEVVLKKQHYLQACAQGSVLLYWGWYWPPVYAMAPLILGQLVFAYAFDMLLSWSRRDSYKLGFVRFQSSSASICSSGSSRTGSICSSRWWRWGWRQKN